MPTNWLLLGLIPYLLLLIYWLKGIVRLNKKDVSLLKSQSQGCSIVVAFRDEVDQLHKIIASLKAQIIDHDCVEFLFIDDHSEDNGPSILQELSLKDNRFRIEKMEHGQGKKAAIRKGVELAKFDYILTTDADCQLTKNWVEIMLNTFESQKLDLLAAPVSYINKGFWTIIFNMEQAGLMAATAGSIGNDSGFICNGANLMFRRDDYLNLTKAELKADLPSGDDVFLLHAIKKRKAAKISFLPREEVTSYTTFPTSLRAFIAQRVRWLQKGKAYDDRDAWLQSTVILSANVLVLLAPLLLLLGQINLIQFLLVFFIKYLADLVLVYAISAWFKPKGSALYSFFLAILYPFYSLLIAFLSLFYRPKWKGRSA